MSIQTINPATGKLIATYSELSPQQANLIIQAGHKAFLSWRETNWAGRAQAMLKAGQLLLAQKESLAALITQEMGKPIKSARAEIEKCAWLCEHYAEHAEQYLAPHTIQTEYSKSYVCYQPLGVIFAIMPWNFPFWQVFRFAVPNLMAGNCCVLKPAPTTTGCGLAITKLLQEAGFPEAVFQTVTLSNSVAEQLIAHPLVAGVTLTGSVKAGQAVGSQAAGHLKKVVLELGGSDPYIILEDADLDFAAEQCVKSRLNNAGQVCIAAKRFIVVDEIRELFEQKVITKAEQYQMGNPMDEAVTLGPLAREDLRATVHRQVQDCLTRGAQLVMGGHIPPGAGYFYPVTVLKNVKPSMPAYNAEIFGPVIAFITAENAAEAIQIANSTPYGLGAAVFTQDVSKGEAIAQQLEAGTCCVNALVSSDPRLPFGGTKASGFGRELGAEGIREFTNIKTICVK